MWQVVLVLGDGSFLPYPPRLMSREQAEAEVARLVANLPDHSAEGLYFTIRRVDVASNGRAIRSP